MSGICAFFGHRDTPITPELERKLEKTILDLIDEGIDEFWCCEQGNFDWLSRMVMLKIKKSYPFIHLCYIPTKDIIKYPKMRQHYITQNYEVIYTSQMVSTHPRFSIIKRNQYIAENSDVIICYLTTNKGGAYNAVNIAQKYNKRIINIALQD